jgi:Transaldolase/Fructose-6-phosphate aldolase
MMASWVRRQIRRSSRARSQRETRTTTSCARFAPPRPIPKKYSWRWPGRTSALPAIEETIAAEIPVNVTLLFSLERHREAARLLRGLRRLKDSGGDLASVASVASFLVSRVGTEADRCLEEIGGHDELPAAPWRSPAQSSLTKATRLAPVRQMRRVQPLTPEELANLAGQRARLRLGQDPRLVLRAERPALGLLDELRVRHPCASGAPASHESRLAQGSPVIAAGASLIRSPSSIPRHLQRPGDVNRCSGGFFNLSQARATLDRVIHVREEIHDRPPRAAARNCEGSQCRAGAGLRPIAGIPITVRGQFGESGRAHLAIRVLAVVALGPARPSAAAQDATDLPPRPARPRGDSSTSRSPRAPRARAAPAPAAPR